MNFKEILDRKIDVQAELRKINTELNHAVLNLSPEVIQAWDDGLVKFNFTILPWVRAELKNKLKLK